MTFVSETRVLRPIDKLVHTDPDYWPTFHLQNVRVLPHGKVKSKYARCVNLLDASIQNPVCIVGELEEIEEENLDRVLDLYQESHDRASLILPNVTNFCYGEQDGICKVWAEGEAGWFEVQPAEQYQDIYIRMLEAIAMWYYLEDQHNVRASPGGKAQNPDVDTLFEVYLKKHREYELVERVEGLFLQNQPFLLSQMKRQDTEDGDEDNEITGKMNWADTNIYHYFVNQTPQDTASSVEDADSPDDEAEIDNPMGNLTTLLPQKRTKAGKSVMSAGLRPKGLTPKTSARHKSARASSALAMSFKSAEENEQVLEDGDGKRTVINQMKKAGARTDFLEAFLAGRDGS